MRTKFIYSRNNTTITTPLTTRQDPQKLRDTLGHAVAKTIQDITKKTEEAQNYYIFNPKLLNTAVWYPIDYAKALQKSNQTRRLTWLQDKRHLSSGFLNLKYFTPVEKSGIRSHWEFVIKDDISASDALAQAIAGPSILDCGTVCQIARYNTLLLTLGTEKFDRLFQKAHGEPLCVSYKDNERQPMRYFVTFTEDAMNLQSSRPKQPNHRTVKVGQVVSFNNHQNYPFRHTNEMGGNYNVACLQETPGKQRFIGHGTPSTGLSEREFCQLLANAYNEDTQDDAVLRAPQALRQDAEQTAKMSRTISPHQITADQVPGFDDHSPQDFNVDLINDLIALPTEKITIDVVKGHPQAQRSLQQIEATQPIQNFNNFTPVDFINNLLKN